MIIASPYRGSETVDTDRGRFLAAVVRKILEIVQGQTLA
jgi:hypothetical protein